MEKFEGPEKKLEIVLFSPQTGLRNNTDGRWDRVVRACGAEILKRESIDRLDSYILSESSLFVWDDRILIITCGKTNPAKALPVILEYIDRDQVACLFYKRKNLNFPDEQPTGFEEDAVYLQNYFPGKSIRLGPADADHLHVFYYAKPGKNLRPDVSLQLLMHDIDPAVGNAFYFDSAVTDRQSDIFARITGLYPAMIIDSHFFYPQGYSLNGISETNYFTIHVTPQPEASYVSFESNIFNRQSERVIAEIVSIFRPSRYSLVLTSGTHNGFDGLKDAAMAVLPGYQTMDQLQLEFNRHYTTTFSNYRKQRH